MQLQNGTLKSRGEVPQEAKCFLRKGKAISDETGKDEKKTEEEKKAEAMRKANACARGEERVRIGIRL